MSFFFKNKYFGEYSLISFGWEDLSVSLIPNKGAYIHEINIFNQQILDNYQDKADLDTFPAYKNVVLSPFPNRLRNGSYSWNGKQYKFPINDQDSEAALHGFGAAIKFNIDHYSFAKNTAQIYLSTTNSPPEFITSYPFKIKHEIVLSLNRTKHLVSWNYTVSNLEEKTIPIGIAWHPYFKLNKIFSNWRIKMPSSNHIELENAFPTGKTYPSKFSKDFIAINPQWDDCFALDTEDKKVILEGQKYQLILTQTGDVKYTQLYVPPEQNSIAIEPMSCGVNAFQKNKDEIKLMPKKKKTIGLNISLLNKIESSN